MNEDFYDPDKCSRCGGKCCLIYRSIFDGGGRPADCWFDEWVEQWDEEFNVTGANKISPLFDPLEVHMTGNEQLRNDLLSKGIDPDRCKYCGINGCILEWNLRPDVCRKYNCDLV